MKKKIFIATDSRGFRHFGHNKKNLKSENILYKNWVDMLIENFSIDYEIIMGGYYKKNKTLVTIFSIEKELKKLNQYFDIIIVQSGINEYVVPWPKKIWDKIIPTETNNSDFCDFDNNYLFLKNKKIINKSIENIKKFGKYCLFIGMHSWLNNSQAIKRKPHNYIYHESVLKMNDIFSNNMEVDYFHMPMSFSWVEQNTYDYMHYTPNGHKFIFNYINKYIQNIGKTIPEILSISKGKAIINGVSKNFNEFYKNSIKIGNEISKLTNEGDVILISKKTSFEQIESFLGSIIYKRIPVIISHPSNKVSIEEFDKKIKNICNIIKPKLCICDKEDYDLFFSFLNSIFSLNIDTENKIDNISFFYNPNDIAFIQLSSGTTSLPKILYISHKALIEQCNYYKDCVSLNENSMVISWLPLYHDMGLIACFLLPLITGCSFVHINPFNWLLNPKQLLELISKHKGTHVWLPNFAFSYLSKLKINEKYDLSSVKYMINCSEIAYRKDMRNFYNKLKDTGLSKKKFNSMLCFGRKYICCNSIILCFCISI